MTPAKSRLIDAIAEQNGLTEKKSTGTVETILDITRSAIASDDWQEYKFEVETDCDFCCSGKRRGKINL